jgi:hypothetical protein
MEDFELRKITAKFSFFLEKRLIVLKTKSNINGKTNLMYFIVRFKK